MAPRERVTITDSGGNQLSQVSGAGQRTVIGYRQITGQAGLTASPQLPR